MPEDGNVWPPEPQWQKEPVPPPKHSISPVFRGAVLCLSFALPFLMLAVYLSYSRMHYPISESRYSGDSAAFGISLLTGTGFLFFIPMGFPIRLLTLALHVIVGGFMLYLFMLFYVCNNFGECL